MKLYTEEQVLKFINDNFDEGCSSINLLTPIELPSDEEIDKFASFNGIISTSRDFQRGAKWMRDKIINIKEK